MTRAEIWWHERPDKKARPALILTRDDAIDDSFDIIAVPTTTKIRGAPTEIHLDDADGMPSRCALVVGNTFLAEKIYFTKHLTTLSSVRMSEVCRMLAYATSCPS
jgi:mRNA-degrading endonuclease toxin of MazEF toxin-antitoxin module